MSKRQVKMCCEQCTHINYRISKTIALDGKFFQLRKYCRFCSRTTLHFETR